MGAAPYDAWALLEQEQRGSGAQSRHLKTLEVLQRSFISLFLSNLIPSFYPTALDDRKRTFTEGLEALRGRAAADAGDPSQI